jgi:putative selenate reductase molybdopterin-binding subunit
VLVDDVPAYANLMLAVQANGKDIRTADGLGSSRNLSIVQQAMIDAGVVQSAYNAPEAALLLTWLLEHNSHPTTEDVKQVLSGIFIRDAGYERYYLAVRLAVEKRDYGAYREPTAPSFRKNLSYVGKPMGKIDGPQLVAGERSYVEDRIGADTPYSLYVLGSPYASAFITSIDTTEAEKAPGVVRLSRQPIVRTCLHAGRTGEPRAKSS